MKTTALAIVAVVCLIGAFLAYGPGWQGGLIAVTLIFLAGCISWAAAVDEVDHLAARKRRIAARAAGERWGKR